MGDSTATQGAGVSSTSAARSGLAGLPGVHVDRFPPGASGYFLTHAHGDHTAGLERVAPGARVFCTAETADIIRLDARFASALSGLTPLPLNEARCITLEGSGPAAERPRGDGDAAEQQLTVTLLDARHCPGSAMFLFERPGVRVLHTGDCRLEGLRCVEECVLKVVRPELKALDHLYLDTTFCHQAMASLPSREVSRSVVVERAISHLSAGAARCMNEVHVDANMLGYEQLILELAQAARARFPNTKVRPGGAHYSLCVTLCLWHHARAPGATLGRHAGTSVPS